MYCARPDQSRVIAAGAVIRMHAGAADLDQAGTQMLQARQIEFVFGVVADLAGILGAGYGRCQRFRRLRVAHHQMLAVGIVDVVIDARGAARQIGPHFTGKHAVAQALRFENLALSAGQADGQAFLRRARPAFFWICSILFSL
jgi:hypothetical protein